MNAISNDRTTRRRTGVPIPRVLTIAGTDPSGGAGIQADLKSIAANGGYGMAVVTALVAQNTVGVRAIHKPPVDFLAKQLDAVGDDVTIDALKIGMLFDGEVAEVVREWLRRFRPPVTVLDPVMVSASGDRLLDDDAEVSVRDLLHVVDLVTPNVPELAVLTGEPAATTWDEVLDQAARLSGEHDVLVLAKGGHLDSPTASDALVSGAEGVVAEFTADRVATRNTHGTGCSLSAAVATLRSRHGAWEPAVAQAKAWLTESIEAADELDVGRGNGPVAHFAGLWRRGGTAPSPSPLSIAGEWWESISDVRAAIHELPFIQRLADGSLERDVFSWYLGQDALYLRDYSRVLAEASRLAPTPTEQAFWAKSAHAAIETELDLHSRWLPSSAMFDAAPGPVTTGYVNHLLATASKGAYRELIAAALPCFWIYVDAGSRLMERGAPANPYAAWIEAYSDPAFAEVNRQAVHIVTSHAAAASEADRLRMHSAFESSARHELAFFAAPYTRAPGVGACSTADTVRATAGANR